VVSNYTFMPLTPLAVEQPAPVSWPASIGGYSLESKSNLVNDVELWQNVTNNVLPTNNLNRVTITTTKPGGR
jgi:hypothetical protein